MADWKEMLNALTRPSDSPEVIDVYDPEDVRKNRGFAMLSYLSWAVLVPILFARESPYARFHANQGLVLAVAETVVGFVLGLLRHMPLIGWLFGLAGSLLGVAFFLLILFGVCGALKGKTKELPFLGGFRLLR